MKAPRSAGRPTSLDLRAPTENPEEPKFEIHRVSPAGCRRSGGWSRRSVLVFDWFALCAQRNRKLLGGLRQAGIVAFDKRRERRQPFASSASASAHRFCRATTSPRSKETERVA